MHVEPLEARDNPSFTWTGFGMNNLWDTAANWDQNAVPGQYDDAIISQPGARVTVNSTDAIHNLAFSDGLLIGPGTLTINGTMTWTGGTLSNGAYGPPMPGMPPPSSTPGTLEIAQGAILNIEGYQPKFIQGWTINADAGGTINWLNGDVNNSDSTVNVAVGATFNISTQFGTWRDQAQDGLSTINNAGTMTSSGGLMPVSIEAALNMSGEFDVTAGNVALRGGGSYSGTFSIADGSDLVLANGVFTALQGGQDVGTGRFVIGNGGQAAVDLGDTGGVTVTHRNVVLNTGGSITGAGILQMAGTSKWLGGSIDLGPFGEVVNSADLEIRTNQASLTGGTLVNSAGASIVWRTDFAGAENGVNWIVRGTISNEGNLQIVTASGTTARINANQPANVSGRIANTGTINVIGPGAAEFYFLRAIDNSGIINVQGGKLTFSNISNLFTNSPTGRLTAAANSAVYFLNGTYVFRGISTGPADRQMDGDGYFIAGQGCQVVVPSNFIGAIENGNVDWNFVRARNFSMLNGSRLAGSGRFEARSLSCYGGKMTTATINNVVPDQNVQGVTWLEAGDVMVIYGDVSMDNRLVLDNSGARINWNPTADTITVTNGSTISVNGGTFEIYNLRGLLDMPNAADASAVTLSNGGVLRKQYLEGASPTDVTTMTIPVVNIGGVLIAEGNVTLTKVYRQLDGATLNLGNGHYNFFQLATIAGSTVNLDNGELVVTNSLEANAEQRSTSFNLSGLVRGWLLNSLCRNCTISLQGDLDLLDGNNQIQLNLVYSTLHLHGFALNIPQGQISNYTSFTENVGVYLEGGALTYQGIAGNGNIQGPGTINGSVAIGTDGTLTFSQPGAFGATAVNGDVTLQDGSRVYVQIGSGECDGLVVQGQITLAGQLTGQMLGYAPEEGDVINIIHCVSHQGWFDNSTIELSGGYYFQVDYSHANWIRLLVMVHS